MNSPLIYTELAEWWPLVSAPEDYADEAGLYRELFERHSAATVATVLELGSGGGNTASHLTAHYDMTLSDLSPAMLAVSAALNPGCEHIPGDMRSLRLGRSFDAVLIHDAIDYMTTEADLRAALETAFVHCKPGGSALFCPDGTKETWRPQSSHGGGDSPSGGRERSLRYLEWCFDPDPADTLCTCVYAFMMRDGQGPVRHAVDEHTTGLFPQATWLRLIADVGFEPRAVAEPYGDADRYVSCEIFVGVRSL